MVANIDDLKGLISQKDGVARANLFRVELPPFPGVTRPEINLLCKNVNMPGRQILTREKTIGLQTRKVSYGYASDDITMTFQVLNDYGVKKYFEYWQSKAVNQTSYEIGYKKEYAKPVKIQQLKKTQNATVDDIIYEVELFDAFPTTMNQIQMSNDLDQLVELTVQLSYTNWKSNFEKVIKAPKIKQQAYLDFDAVGTINGIFDKNGIPNTPQEIFDFTIGRVI